MSIRRIGKIVYRDEVKWNDDYFVTLWSVHDMTVPLSLFSANNSVIV